MKKMMFLSKNWYFSVQKALIYYTVNKSHHNSFILLVFWHVANFRYVANFRFLTLVVLCYTLSLNKCVDLPGVYYRKDSGLHCISAYWQQMQLTLLWGSFWMRPPVKRVRCWFCWSCQCTGSVLVERVAWLYSPHTLGASLFSCNIKISFE